MESFGGDLVETPASNLTLHRYKRTNQGFEEDLGNGVALTLMLIPEGEFLMGAPEDEPYSQNTERPQHPVRVPKFLMGKYPVTQAQWKVVADMPEVDLSLHTDPSEFKGENLPVERVSWDDAVEFCTRLSVYTNREYRLPSEAEWEYACRAGTEAPFHFGETIMTELANYRGTDDESTGFIGSYAQEPKGEYREKTTPVDQFNISNAFGLSDMHGNIWEWCQDLWHKSYNEAPTDGSAWLTETEYDYRVLRGGSWLLNPWQCRSVSRIVFTSDERVRFIGF